MKVLIFGATGGIGKWAVKHALMQGHEVTVFVRNASKVQSLSGDVRVIEGSIEDFQLVCEALKNQEAVIWCVGIPMTNKYERMVSLAGHRILLEAMGKTGVKRLIDWGTPSVKADGDKRSFITLLPPFMASILFSKAKAEMVAIGELLKASDLDWVMVRFMMPKDTPYTGEVVAGFGDKKMNWAISREDIAAFMIEQLTNNQFLHKMPIIGTKKN